MKENSHTDFINELIGVLFHNLLYYIPSEIIGDKVLDEINNEIPDNFLDELSLADNDIGTYSFNNKDGVEVNQRLLEKRSQLERNTFKLLKKSKELNSLEFHIIVQKYCDELLLFIFITDWLNQNLNKYHKAAINFSLIGAFKFQLTQFKSHLNEVVKYFNEFLDLETQYDFSPEKFVIEHIQNLLSRFNQLNKNISKEDKLESDNNTNISEPLISKSIKKRPVINNENLEKMILEQVFKVELNWKNKID